MGLNVVDGKIRVKRSPISGATPSLGVSSNYLDGSWSDTDIYEGEFFLNNVDDLLWIRTANGIKEIDLIGASGSADFLKLTGGTMSGNIGMATSTLIKSANGGGQIDLDYSGSAGNVLISTDSGSYNEAGLDMSDTYGIYLYANSGGAQSLLLGGSNDEMLLRDITNNLGIAINPNSNSAADTISMFKSTSNSITSVSTDNHVFINSHNSFLGNGVNSSVMIGGVGLTGSDSNTVYTPDLNIQTGKVIKTNNGGGQIELDDGGSANIVNINNDTGGFTGEGVYFSPSYTALWADGFVQAVEMNGSGSGLNIYDTTAGSTGFVQTQANSVRIKTKTESGGTGVFAEIYAIDNSSGAVSTNDTENNNAVFIASKNSTINSGVVNSVIVGGYNNTIAGNEILITGRGNYSSGYGSFLFGDSSYNISSNSIVGGFGCTNSNSSGLVIGSYNENTGAYSVVAGGYNNSNSDSGSVVAGGSHNINSGSYSAIIGGNNNNNSGDSSIILGCDTVTNTADYTVCVPDLHIQADKGIKFGTGNLMIFKEIEIGDWDMDASTEKGASHGLSATEWKTIRNISCTIRDDSDTLYHNQYTQVGATNTSPRFNSTIIALRRDAGGVFDNTSYDSTSYNRGWINFWYTAD